MPAHHGEPLHTAAAWAGGAGRTDSLAQAVDPRTRFFDRYLAAAMSAGCSQAVLLAAGFDGRAYRLPWPPGTSLFEIDLPTLLRIKARVMADQCLQPRCRRTAVAADLREDWSKALLAAGFRPTIRTAWLAEGQPGNLDSAQTCAMFTALGLLSAPGSRLSFQFGRPGDRDTEPDGDTLVINAISVEALTWLAADWWDITIHDQPVRAGAYGRSDRGDQRRFVTAIRGARGHKPGAGSATGERPPVDATAAGETRPDRQ